ncbi:NUDIX hydrolase [Brevibacillus porteri]|uniref:NUDIX hydrolase n=1 Tax=Brevibacillus porteri TaxID=2126350 RepID=UPI001ABF12BE|nr:NUDIX domain-containing protein [Brevibacillus porteri]MED1798854.1 NUDIX domain-containing protein [Brevibacillus porteri]MED2131537.1 NUDIX domain-containing protein [Brevibacillus porteri]MED2896622.1 NUDIX domain-containing protein [Brevibacillus porteri]
MTKLSWKKHLGGKAVLNDYIGTMRKYIGHETLLTVGCGAIIEDDCGRILLQQKRDIWGLPGGLLEIGETFEETVRREVLEETNLKISQIKLFGIYSGKKGFAQYANGDKVFSVQIIFHVTKYEGTVQGNEESTRLQFIHKKDMPSNLNPHQAPFILDWLHGIKPPIIK